MQKLITIFFILMSIVAVAQDPEFAQYYAAPLYLNPAFSGTSVDHRFNMNYRNQWPNITNAFQTYAFSYDYNLDQLNSGLGVLLLVDKAGTAQLQSQQINFQYSYKVRLSDTWMLSSGLNFGLGTRSIDYNKLIFYNELDFLQSGGIPPDKRTDTDRASYFDFGGGMLAYNKKFWIGFAAAHLNRPNRSLTDNEAQIPIKTTIHGGFRLPLYNGIFKKDRVAALAPSFVYKQQGKFDQLDIGTYFLYEPVVLGLWYRGIPIRQNVNDNISQDAVVVILGFRLDKFEFTYSYDVTVSELGPISGGAHELALMFKIDVAASVKTRKKEKFIPCPTFHD